ncbi:MAG TPA: hypothetical protein VME40_14375, partial [Caulobacteraceae bacterium]|nr:hypothetical protein [Caulobacteraceae bacterium]
ALVTRHLNVLQDTGLDRLAPDTVQRLRERYAPFADHPAAREILAWLGGAYRPDMSETAP